MDADDASERSSAVSRGSVRGVRLVTSPGADRDGEYVSLSPEENAGSPVAAAPPSKMNYNVVLTLVTTAVMGMADSIWSSTALAAYLYIINDENNAKVGYVEAAQGLATLFTALPVGYIADKYGRGLAAAIGGFAFIFADAATTFAVWSEEQDPANTDKAYLLMIVAMVLWGLGGGVVSGPIQALYADSIPTGDRSKYVGRGVVWGGALDHRQPHPPLRGCAPTPCLHGLLRLLPSLLSFALMLESPLA